VLSFYGFSMDTTREFLLPGGKHCLRGTALNKHFPKKGFRALRRMSEVPLQYNFLARSLPSLATFDGL
jgi:hypothetical protein